MLLTEEYLDNVVPYMSNITNDHKIQRELKIQLTHY